MIKRLIDVTEVNVGWATFGIEFTDEDFPSTEEKCFGDCDMDTYIIRIDSKQSNEAIQETLLHELTHLVLRTPGFEDMISIDEEQLVVLLTRGFLTISRLNPTLIKLLLL